MIYNQSQKENKYCNIVLINLSVEYFVDGVCKQAWLLYEHHVKKNSQTANLKQFILVLPEDHALLLLEVE